MSSLQKFHRRTQSVGPVGPFTTIGSGNDTVGFWLGTVSSNKLIIAPKSSETSLKYGSYGTVRGNTSTTNGLANTNTLYAFGNSITTGHPAAVYCKNLTTGGYNTWYLPAKDELMTIISNKAATPFATTSQFQSSSYTIPTLTSTYYNTSTESTGNYHWVIAAENGTATASSIGKNWTQLVRAVRIV
jgi:hypothetical protein